MGEREPAEFSRNNLQQGPVPSVAEYQQSFQNAVVQHLAAANGQQQPQSVLPPSVSLAAAIAAAAEFLQSAPNLKSPDLMQDCQSATSHTTLTIPTITSSSCTTIASNDNSKQTSLKAPSINQHAIVAGMVCNDGQQLHLQSQQQYHQYLSTSLMNNAITPLYMEDSTNSRGGNRGDFFTQIIETLPESQYLERNKLKVNDTWYHVNEDGSFYKLSSSRLDGHRHKRDQAMRNIYYDHANILCGPPSAFMPPPPSALLEEEECRILRMQRPFGKFKFNSNHRRIDK